MDLSKIAENVKDTELAPITRGRDSEPNPFGPIVKASFDAQTGKAVKVPLAGESGKTGDDLNVVKVVNMIRTAAANEGLGVSVQIDYPENRVANRNATVKFLGKVKTVRERKSADVVGDRVGVEPTEAATA